MAATDADEYDDHGYGEASRYAAHLDRGWALLEQGDTDSARNSADHALQVRPDDPDAAMLLGAIALAEGRPDESLKCYERALELDPEYLDPYVAAAQVCLFDLDDPARAQHYCDDALELEGLGPFDRLDLDLMAAECELARGLDDHARARLDALPSIAPLAVALQLGAAAEAEGEVDADSELEIDLQTERGVALAFLRTDPEGELLDEAEQGERVSRTIRFALRLARLRIDLSQTAHASELMGQLTELYPRDADAWYLLSEAAYRDGAASISSHAAMRTLDLDGGGTLAGWVPSPAMVHRSVVEILRGCPDAALRRLVEGDSPIAIVVRDTPPPELVMEGVDPRIAALALASRSAGTDLQGPPATTLTGLAVYRRCLARYARDAEHFEAELRLSVIDELATFLGLDDGRRDAVGLPPLPPALRAAVVAEAPDPVPTEETDEPKRARSRRRRRA